MSETRDGQRRYDTSGPAAQPITEHPDVQRLIAETVELQAENERLTKALSGKGEYGYSQEVVDALTKDRDEIRTALLRHGRHDANCEPFLGGKVTKCVCGWSEVLELYLKE